MGPQGGGPGRTGRVDEVRSNPRAQVLIIGGGINGLATFRDVALQGVSVVVVDRSDFCSGASAASSHMIHGGVRYLENGELRLVKESLQERNRLLAAAPHYVRPLKTTIPIFSLFSGLLAAPARLLRHAQGRPTERGALLIKIGLMLYDLFGRDGGRMPGHRFLGATKSRAELPELHPDVKYTATYFDAAMENPERLALDVLRDGLEAGTHARAINYLAAVGYDHGAVILRDEVTGDEFSFVADVIVNASGPWTDLTNAQLGRPTQFMGGTKGSHVVLDNARLLAACDGREIFFENSDGRIVLMYPIMGRVLVGTTDIPVDMSEEIVCTDDEVEYFFDLVRHVFPRIHIDHADIVYRYAGVRPLPASGDTAPGFVSRDYRIVPGSLDATPLLSLVGGKWTTFRALGEHLTDETLAILGRQRLVGTRSLPIGGGRGFPTTTSSRRRWVSEHRGVCGEARVEALLLRYGTYAGAILRELEVRGDVPLRHHADYSLGEIQALVANEWVVSLSDVLYRRTTLAFSGQLTPALVAEIAGVMASMMGWDAGDTAREISTITPSKTP